MVDCIEDLLPSFGGAAHLGAIGRTMRRRQTVVRQWLILRAPLDAAARQVLRTQTHADWPPIPRMRAATLARLAHRQLIALGGMNEQRYAKIAALGFKG
jgi:hypothetical protein